MARNEPDSSPQQTPKSGRGLRFYLVIGISALALIFVIQNTERTNVTFLFADTELPLFFALIISIALGILIGWLTPRVRRSDRHEK